MTLHKMTAVSCGHMDTVDTWKMSWHRMRVLEAHLDVTRESMSEVERCGGRGWGAILREGVGFGLLTCRHLRSILRGSCGVAS